MNGHCGCASGYSCQWVPQPTAAPTGRRSMIYHPGPGSYQCAAVNPWTRQLPQCAYSIKRGQRKCFFYWLRITLMPFSPALRPDKSLPLLSRSSQGLFGALPRSQRTRSNALYILYKKMNVCKIQTIMNTCLFWLRRFQQYRVFRDMSDI